MVVRAPGEECVVIPAVWLFRSCRTKWKRQMMIADKLGAV